MIIKRYNKKYININLRISEAINMSNVTIRPCVGTCERPCSILDSIKASLLEVKEFNKGKIKLNSLSESKREWNDWIKEVEDGK